MEMEQIIRLIKEVSDSKLRTFKYTEGNLNIELSKNQESKEDAYRLEETSQYQHPNEVIINKDKEDENIKPEEGQDNKDLYIIKSPIVGTFYSSPSEEGAPYVEVGDLVKQGQVVAIVEAMKIMNEIESTVDGVVEEVLVKNQEIVEFGQPLFVINLKGE